MVQYVAHGQNEVDGDEYVMLLKFVGIPYSLGYATRSANFLACLLR